MDVEILYVITLKINLNDGSIESKTPSLSSLFVVFFIFPQNFSSETGTELTLLITQWDFLNFSGDRLFCFS